MHWNELLNEKENAASKETKIPLALTYNRSLPNISKVVRKQWNVLSINKSSKEFVQNELVIAFKCNKNLKELIGSNKTKHNKVKKHVCIFKNSKCSRDQ